MTRTRLRYVDVAVSALLAASLVAGCNDDDGDGQGTPTTPTTDSTEEQVTTTTAGATTTVEATTTTSTTVVDTTATTTSTSAPPPPSTPGEQTDWVGVLQEVLDRGDALFAAPDVAKVGTVTMEGSAPYQELEEEIANLVNNGWVYRTDGVVVQSAEVADINDAAAPTEVQLTVVFSPTPGGVIVDASGAVVQEIPARSETSRWSYALVRNTVDEPWRIVDRLRLFDEWGL